MFVPGAARSTQSPRLEKDARPSLPLVALTAITFGYAAGYCRLEGDRVFPSLPAAATTSAPLLDARLTAFLRMSDSPGPPNERLTTSAWWSTLQFMPLIILESLAFSF